MVVRICVVGLGYIGLPTAVVLAQAGQEVIGVDKVPAVVDEINAGRLHFVEPGLEEVLAKVVSDGALVATTTPTNADVYIIAVPTPITTDNRADLSYVEAASREIAPVLSGGELLILESTSPPGATEQMRDWIAQERPELDIDSIDFAHGPERVLPGQILEELVANDRIVGGLTQQASERAKEVYALFCQGEIFMTNARTAEAAKLVENSFRDVNIAFANELSLIADKLEIDVWELIALANRHPRVNILTPGPGVGGHCIAVDPWFLAEAAPDEAKMVRMARNVNDAKPGFVLDQIRRAGAEEASKIALLGLAFKKNVDDLRGSPSVAIAQQVAQAFPQAHVVAVEPYITELPRELQSTAIELVSIEDASNADVVVLLVDHDVFAQVPETLGDNVNRVDTRGLWQ
ncbi:MAG: UDP-N-acetyl-D-mannosamine dehydrogenase [Aeromicrobium sp.]|nr:MAG: UDP-N-acetyl-D-mannosamine dehydrogenase [Aeromicrobium sp.]